MIDREITVGARTLQSFPEILGCVFEQSERELIYVTYDKNSHNLLGELKPTFCLKSVEFSHFLMVLMNLK